MNKAERYARSYHSIERVMWMKRKRCDGCGGAPGIELNENAHLPARLEDRVKGRNGGMGLKTSYHLTVSLCPWCHVRDRDSLDSTSVEAFDKVHGSDLYAAADAHTAEWEARDENEADK